MADLFEGLPPPSASTTAPEKSKEEAAPSPPPPPPPQAAPPPRPALKSALKRDKPSPATTPSPAPDADPHDHATEKRIRFRTTVDTSETQIIEAMQKITSHINNPSKFSKASKLALQLIEAGSVKPGTINHFFTILEAAMSSPSACNEASLRADYQALFMAAQDVTEYFNQQQTNQFTIWTMQAVLGNDLHTDDSFVFSKAVGKIKDAIATLPLATVDDDNDEAAVLVVEENKANATENKETSAQPAVSVSKVEVSDPFGLNTLLLAKSKKSEKARGKEVAALNKKSDEEESKKFLKAQREVLLKCLEIAAKRYRVPWTQTTIDILTKHAYDHINRFTCQQRAAIEKLWVSIKEQQIKRKQGKSVTGKLDVNAFERLQEKYAHEKISIRHSVGGGADCRAQQWLG